MARLIARAGGTDGAALGALRPRIPSLFESSAAGNPDRDDADDDGVFSDEPPPAPSLPASSPHGLEAPPARAETRHDSPFFVEPSAVQPRNEREPERPQSRTVGSDRPTPADALLPRTHEPSREGTAGDAPGARSRRSTPSAASAAGPGVRGARRATPEALAPRPRTDDGGPALPSVPAAPVPRHAPIVPARRSAPYAPVAEPALSAPAAPQPIHVTIGRVEVRGVIDGEGQSRRAPSAEPAVSTLDAYLRRRARDAS